MTQVTPSIQLFKNNTKNKRMKEGGDNCLLNCSNAVECDCEALKKSMGSEEDFFKKRSIKDVLK